MPEEDRRQYHLFLDEFSMFSAQSEEALARVLSLARKYGLYLTLAHQTWSQVSNRLQGALQNAVEISFKLGRADAQATAPRYAKFEPHLVKHEVVNPWQVDRTHPVFFSIQEQLESWTQELVDLKPREAYVKTANKSAKVRSLVPPRGATQDEIRAITDTYANKLLVPKGHLESMPEKEPAESRPARISRIAVVSNVDLVKETDRSESSGLAPGSPPPSTGGGNRRSKSPLSPSACESCGAGVLVGSTVAYYPQDGRMLCDECGADLEAFS